MALETASGCCAACVHFRGDPDFLEKTFGGLIALSSARGSVRADDGICLLHGRYLSARASCARFQRLPGRGAEVGRDREQQE